MTSVVQEIVNLFIMTRVGDSMTPILQISEHHEDCCCTVISFNPHNHTESEVLCCFVNEITVVLTTESAYYKSRQKTQDFTFQGQYSLSPATT